MANIENGNNTTGLANVDANFGLVTTTPQVNTRFGGETGAPNFVGAVRMFSENDSGLLSGTPLLQSPWTSSDQNLQVGVLTPLYDFAWNSTAQDTGQWTTTSTTMTATAAGGFLNLNAGNIGTAATGIFLATRRYFNLTSNGGLRFSMVASISQAPAANSVWYAGIGVPVGSTTVPTDGVWFQYSSAGLIGVISYNGSITQTGALPVISPLAMAANTNKLLQIRIFDRAVYFLYDSSVIGILATPAAQGCPFMSDALPMFLMQVNTGTVTGGTFMQFKVAAVGIEQIDSNLGKPYQHIQASKGLTAYQGPSGAVMGSSALYTNSLAPGAGLAMTNTTAALGVGLGGQFAWLPTLAANTDGILCSFANPVGGVNQTPRTLYITGVRIQSVVTTVLVGGPVIEFYSLAYGHTALPLNTGESASFASGTTKAARRIALGIEIIAATAAVGAISSAPLINVQFVSPIVVNPGEFVAIAAKNVGTVTSSGVITTLVTYDGYYE